MFVLQDSSCFVHKHRVKWFLLSRDSGLCSRLSNVITSESWLSIKSAHLNGPQCYSIKALISWFICFCQRDQVLFGNTVVQHLVTAFTQHARLFSQKPICLSVCSSHSFLSQTLIVPRTGLCVGEKGGAETDSVCCKYICQLNWSFREQWRICFILLSVNWKGCRSVVRAPSC